jgi:hypothetical protein
MQHPQVTVGTHRGRTCLYTVEGIIDVDVIPSPQVEPVEHHTGRGRGKAPTMVRMDIDSQGSVGGQNPSTTRNPQQPSRAEATHQKNGIDSERIESDEPGHSLW